MSARYVWRVTGKWPPLSELGDDEWPPSNPVRHYHSRSSAMHRAKVWREGQEFEGREAETGAPEFHIIPPALTVTVERSEPVTFPKRDEDDA